MFYVIKREYVGPNQDDSRFINADTVIISTEPARTNMSDEIRINGWCGTTHNWSITAHGEYETLESAQIAIPKIFGSVRDVEILEDDVALAWDVVDAYRIGKFETMTTQETEDWLFASMEEDVTAHISDERIVELASEYEKLANEEGWTLNGKATEIIESYRQELIDDIS